MVEIIFSNKKGKFPGIDEAIRRAEASGETVTAFVLITKKNNKLEIKIDWQNLQNVARFGGKKEITKIIKNRIIEKNYDLLLEEGQTAVMIT